MINYKYVYANKRYLILFLIIEASLLIAMSAINSQSTDKYLHKKSQELEQEYTLVLHSFKDKAEIAFHTLIDTEPVKALLRKTAQTDEAEKSQLRYALYSMLRPAYEKLKKFGFKQVHFHHPNSHSFLRVHAPSHYGDDLSSFRNSVNFVNQTHKSIYSFEEGIANNGFRFVFPLFDNEGYLGSIELSFPAFALADYLHQNFAATQFLIAKDALVSKNMGRLPHNYISSTLHPDFFIEKDHIDNDLQIPYDARLQDIKKHHSSFSFEKKIKGDNYLLTFIPIKNSVTQENSAYLAIASHDNFFAQRTIYFWVFYGALSFIIFMFYARFIKEKIYRKKMKQKNQDLNLANRKLKTILNGLRHMVIITDGAEMIDVNQKVLDFFGFSSLFEMKEKAPCICHFFLKRKDFFHLDLVPENDNWINYIQTVPEKQRTVNMVGKDMVAKAFQINVNSYGPDNKAIITFNDVTNMIIEQKLLEYKAQHDDLTNIYNRQKINEELQMLCQYSGRRKEEVGIVMFDIDHFKKINDTYGHDQGDEVLKTISKLVKRSIRKEDIFGRWGGEEFILILRYATQNEVLQKTQEIKMLLANYHYKDLPKVTASFGVTTLQKPDSTEQLLKRADIALYEAKHQGRNRIVLYREKEAIVSL